MRARRRLQKCPGLSIPGYSYHDSGVRGCVHAEYNMRNLMGTKPTDGNSQPRYGVARAEFCPTKPCLLGGA